MNEKIYEAAYWSGMVADGTPDSWDSAALEKFANRIIDQCIEAVVEANTHQACTTFQLDLVRATMNKSVKAINERFERKC